MPTVDHPIWAAMELQGRKLGWLARRTGYSESHVKAVKAGIAPASPEFRRKCAELLEFPEQLLFLPDSTARPVAAPSGPTDSHAALTEVER